MKIGRFLFLLFGISLLHAQEHPFPSLSEAIEGALNKSYELKNKTLAIEANELERNHLKSNYLPTLNFETKLAYTQMGLKTKTDAIKEINIPKIDLNTSVKGGLFSAGLSSEVLLFSGTKIPKLNKALEEKTKAETALMESDTQNIIENVITAYDRIALLEEVKIVLDEAEKRLEENKRIADKALSYGLITKYDRKKIDLAEVELESKRTDYEGKKHLALSYLQQLTDISYERLEKTGQRLQAYSLLDNSKTIENRSELRALEAQIRANEYKMEAEKTWWIPKIAASASLNYMQLFKSSLKDDNVLPILNEKINYNFNTAHLFPMLTIGVGAKWTIFDGFDGKHKIQLSKIDIEKAKNTKQHTQELLELSLVQAQTELNTAYKQVEVAEKKKEVAKDALLQANKEFRVGLIKALELIEAENDLENAEMGYLQTIFDQRRKAFNLLKTTGNLTKEKVVQ